MPEDAVQVTTKDVVQVVTDTLTLAQLQYNARLSFDVGQYENARADWEKVIQIDRTDHESYWGLVRCDMETRAVSIILRTGCYYEQAWAYAPPATRAVYEQEARAYNAPEVDRLRRERQRLLALRGYMGIAAFLSVSVAIILFFIAVIYRNPSLWKGIIVCSILATALCIMYNKIKKKCIEKEPSWSALENLP